MALTDKLSAIGVAIREKTGKSDLLTLDQMPTEISSITTGGNEPTAEELVCTGNCNYMFKQDKFAWIINRYGDRVTTKDITSAFQMFTGSSLTEIPFQLNLNNCEDVDCVISECGNLIVCPKIRGTFMWAQRFGMEGVCTNLFRLRNLEDLFTSEMLAGYSTVQATSAYNGAQPVKFNLCYSLRQVPSWYYNFKLCETSTVYPTTAYCLYYNAFNGCYVLDEVLNLPVWKCASTQSTAMFSSTVGGCHRLKNYTFETDAEGAPIVTQWTNQVLDLSNTVGYINAYQENNILKYNSGITTAKRVTDDASYQALKDDPDWYTTTAAYSRYNHDSAVATINSLPDTSAAGGVNTIKFKGAAGEKTDGGAINTLTEEEIAVATAKGWTVTLV